MCKDAALYDVSLQGGEMIGKISGPDGRGAIDEPCEF